MRDDALNDARNDARNADGGHAGRRFSLPQVLLVLGTVVFTVALGSWQEHRRGGDDGAEADARARTRMEGPGAGIIALPVRMADGRAVALTQLGAPVVVMVVSTSCGVCKEALADFGRTAAGRALPRLYVLTLEGAGEGPALAARAGVRGAAYVGPATAGAEVYFTTAIAGTPTFIALDAGGHATRVLPGYPGLGAMRGWLGVMGGTRAVVD